MARNYKKVIIENAKLMYRNFAGEKTKFNPEGARNFCVVIPEEDVEKISSMGYTVKYTKPRFEDEEPVPYLKVHVSYRFDPPTIETIIGGKTRERLSESDISILDWADITSADVSFTGSDWESRGDTGTSAYLDSLYANIEEDELRAKYADIPYGN